MTDVTTWHRIQFVFTITYHYLFPQLTMGLALLIVVFKLMAMRSGDARHDETARFWARIFGLNFAMGVVTGIPLEFQFGTNWARFSERAGGLVGQTLAMEGVFAFFLESSFLGLFVYGEKRLGPKAHLGTAVALFLDWRTTGPVHARSFVYARAAWWALLPLWIAVTLATASIRPEAFTILAARLRLGRFEVARMVGGGVVVESTTFDPGREAGRVVVRVPAALI